jgi:hypothetical protein
LEHLVARTVKRTDASKFLYVLNQIDTAAKEDNPEEVVGAWQRAVAQAGLAAGQFYTIYNEGAAAPIEDEGLRERFRAKRDIDLNKIIERMDEVELQRNYRIVSVLETVANELEHDILPKLRDAKIRWRRGVLLGDGIALAGGLALAALLMIYFRWLPPMSVFSFEWLQDNLFNTFASLLGVLVLGGSFHFWMRGLVARKIAAPLSETYGQVDLNLRKAFEKTTGAFQSVFRVEPAGWSQRAAKHLKLVRETVANHIQDLNDRYADPSGRSGMLIEAREDDAPVEKTLAANAGEPATAPAKEPEVAT